MEKDSTSQATSRPYPFFGLIAGSVTGFITALVGNSVANATFGTGYAAYGVGFIALCLGLAFGWSKYHTEWLTSAAAGYAICLGIMLGLLLQAPACFIPMLCGMMCFALGIIIRLYVTVSKKSPPS